MGVTGRDRVCQRFLRHFHLLAIDSFDDRSLTKIFGTLVEGHFGQGYEANILQTGKVRILGHCLLHHRDWVKLMYVSSV